MRLGRRVSTKIGEETRCSVDQMIKEAVLLCEPKACYDRFPILLNDGKKIVLEKKEIISSDFCRVMEGCSQLILFGSTIGLPLMEERERLMTRDITRAVVYDAVGSEMVEEAAEYMHSFLGRLVSKEGMKVTGRRFSPGYGDLALEIQKEIFQWIEPEKIGIRLTESCLMIPEKSVTAFIGVQ